MDPDSAFRFEFNSGFLDPDPEGVRSAAIDIYHKKLTLVPVYKSIFETTTLVCNAKKQ
jgi:hypothetical protein